MERKKSGKSKCLVVAVGWKMTFPDISLIYIYTYILRCTYTYLQKEKKKNIYIYIYIYIHQLIGPVGRVFAYDPKIFKMVLDTSLLNTQQYKVHIEDKVE